jgi:hypothetical protein
LIESSWNPEDANPTAQRNRSWQALTGCAARGHAVGPDDLASLRAGMHAELAEAIRDFDACVCVWWMPVSRRCTTAWTLSLR